MAGPRRNFAIAAALIAALAIGAAVLPSAGWVLGFASVLGVAGVVLFQGNRWRSGSLLAAALAIGLVLVDAVAGIFAPRAHGAGMVYRTEPADWKIADPVLGYRARPNTKVAASATYDGKPIYRVTYTIDATSARVTPTYPAGADTYLFIGDSFMFGEGLDDNQSLAAQFAQARQLRVRSVNLALSGYAANHAVCAFEAGLLDRFRAEKVKAVVTWIIPDHLRRVTGDAEWLGSSPRHALENGAVRHTGTFNEHRWRNPLDGALYLAGEQLAFVKAIGARQREERQVDLMVALMLRLQALAKEKLGAPLLVIYSWPQRSVPGDVVDRMRQAGISLFDVIDVTASYRGDEIMIPHDGHPNAFQVSLIAQELSRRLPP